MLLDVMLGVMIFVMGVLSLGAAVSNCLDGQMALREASRARLVLNNRMNEILSGAVRADRDQSEPLGGEATGITLKQSVVPLDAEDEKGLKVNGLAVVTLSARWNSAGEPQQSDVTFYLANDGSAGAQ